MRYTLSIPEKLHGDGIVRQKRKSNIPYPIPNRKKMSSSSSPAPPPESPVYYSVICIRAGMYCLFLLSLCTNSDAPIVHTFFYTFSPSSSYPPCPAPSLPVSSNGQNNTSGTTSTRTETFGDNGEDGSSFMYILH